MSNLKTSRLGARQRARLPSDVSGFCSYCKLEIGFVALQMSSVKPKFTTEYSFAGIACTQIFRLGTLCINLQQDEMLQMEEYSNRALFDLKFIVSQNNGEQPSK
jgi:hypothetical protein